MALSDIDRLRGLLGEPIPAMGLPEDTMFSADEIDDFIVQGKGNLNRAAFEGWRVKAAHYANLVDTVEGNSSKAYSDLLQNARQMVATFQRSTAGPTEGRTRVGKIVRRA